MRAGVFAALPALALAACSAQGTVPADPSKEPKPALELTGRVVDAADVLSPKFESELAQKLERFETETSVQFVVATTPDLLGQNVADYTRDLANRWGIGSAKKDDGLVLLVAPKERRCRIAVGFGLEKTVTNEEASVIIQESLLPEFRDSNFEAGIDAGVERLILEVTPVELKGAA